MNHAVIDPNSNLLCHFSGPVPREGDMFEWRGVKYMVDCIVWKSGPGTELAASVFLCACNVPGRRNT
jgi:hypothetical protein